MDFLGIDLAKLTFDATLLSEQGAMHYHAFPTPPKAFKRSKHG